MRESAFTAGVDVTLPVIVQGWFCSSWPEGKLLRFPKRASVAGNPGVAASSERFRMAGLQPASAIGCNCALGCVLRRRSSQPVAQWGAGGEREPRLRRAAVRIHAANAVRVAGPDRIFFGLRALGFRPSEITLNATTQ